MYYDVESFHYHLLKSTISFTGLLITCQAHTESIAKIFKRNCKIVNQPTLDCNFIFIFLFNDCIRDALIVFQPLLIASYKTTHTHTHTHTFIYIHVYMLIITQRGNGFPIKIINSQYIFAGVMYWTKNNNQTQI